MQPTIMNKLLPCLFFSLVAIASGCRQNDPGQERDIPLSQDRSMTSPADTNADVTFYDKESVPGSNTYLPDESGGVSAREYQGLQRFLPRSVPGYDMGSPAGGSTQEVQGMTLTSAEQQWMSSDGATRLRIVITDCGTKEGAYALASTFLFPPEIGSEGAKSINDPASGISGVVVHRADGPESQATFGIAGRYIVDVKGSGGGNRSDEVEKIAREVITNLKGGE